MTGDVAAMCDLHENFAPAAFEGEAEKNTQPVVGPEELAVKVSGEPGQKELAAKALQEAGQEAHAAAEEVGQEVFTGGL